MKNKRPKRHVDRLQIMEQDEISMVHTQMLISIANSLMDIADSLKKIEDK